MWYSVFSVLSNSEILLIVIRLNRNLTERSWDNVLAEYIVLAFARLVGFSSLYYIMVFELCDIHINSWYITIFGRHFVPLMCKFAEDRRLWQIPVLLWPIILKSAMKLFSLTQSVQLSAWMNLLHTYLIPTGVYFWEMVPMPLCWLRKMKSVSSMYANLYYKISSVDGNKFVNRKFSSQNIPSKSGFKEV